VKVIEASRLGLNANATEDEIVAAIEALPGKLATLEAERDTWKTRSQEDQAQLVKLRSEAAGAVKQKRDLMIQAAIDGIQIAKSQKAVAEKIYDTSGEEIFKEWVKSQEDSRYLMTRESLRGPIEAAAQDGQVELAQIVAEICANNKDITEAAAVTMAYKRDKTLYGRVRDSKRAKVEANREGTS